MDDYSTKVKVQKRVLQTKTTGRPSTVLAVRHAIDVLRCLSTVPSGLGVSEIARQIGLNKSSISRLLSTLAEEKLVAKDHETSKFRLGVGLISFATPLLSNLEIRRIALPFLERLAKSADETITLSIWDGSQAINVEQVLGANAIQHFAPLGRRSLAHCTASGKALLAEAPTEEFERVLDRDLERFTERTIVDRSVLQSELKKIRHQGYAINEGEFQNEVGAVAAVVRNMEGIAVAVIAASVPLYRFGKDRQEILVNLVSETAAEVSRWLGYNQSDRPKRS